jgi:hypothetical protein
MTVPLTQEYVRQILDYDPVSGIFIWRHRTDVMAKWNTRYAGARAGSIAIGSRGGVRFLIAINKKQYPAAKIAWPHHYGTWPEAIVDHANTNPLDNGLLNLRLATPPQNGWNTSKHKNNTSGFKGVDFRPERQKWRARIRVGNTRLNLGHFTHLQDAVAAYQQAATQFHDTFARTT